MTRALDYFDLAREYDDDPVAAFEHAKARFLVISFTSDWRFSSKRSREIVQALLHAKKSVTYAEIASSYGHDAFLLPIERYHKVLSVYMKNIYYAGPSTHSIALQEHFTETANAQ